MITKDDCMSILLKLEDQGLNINSAMRKLVVAKDLPLDVLKFIAQNRGMEAINFYEMLRSRYNQKKTPLYKNILKNNDDKEITTILACLLTQIVLYSKKLESKDLFLREIRAEEISRVLHDYFKTDDLDQCKKMLGLVKSDLLVLEYLNGRRKLEN
jgi:hypothetical protein